MNYKNYVLTILGILAVFLAIYSIYSYKITPKALDVQNICTDDDLIAKLIVNNVNPFSKFKFIKKRNNDCKILLIDNKEDAVTNRNENFCPALDASTNSVSLLVHTYVNDMYDRENASKELKKMVSLMIPYDYCPQYYGNMLTLAKLKKRLGL